MALGYGFMTQIPSLTTTSGLVDSVNNMGLTWEFSTRLETVTFTDLTVTLMAGQFTMSLYAMPLALYLYLPSSSCHAPGVLCGLIMVTSSESYNCARHKQIKIGKLLSSMIG